MEEEMGSASHYCFITLQQGCPNFFGRVEKDSQKKQKNQTMSLHSKHDFTLSS